MTRSRVTADDLQKIADLAESVARLQAAIAALPPVVSNSPHRGAARQLATAHTRARAQLDAFIDELSNRLD